VPLAPVSRRGAVELLISVPNAIKRLYAHCSFSIKKIKLREYDFSTSMLANKKMKSCATLVPYHLNIMEQDMKLSRTSRVPLRKVV
jgi:hypothetical protein